jgi:TonB family protein
MNAIINYLLEVNAGLLLFMFIYWAVLRNETQFTFKRTYLLFALLGSLIFPLFHFNAPASAQVIPSIGKLIPTYWLPEIVINANGSAATEKVSSGLSIWAVTEWVYLVVIAFLIVLFLYRVISIVKLFATSLTYRWQNYVVSETNEAKPTFSFFHFILIGQANQLTKTEKEEILIHESIHVKKLHSLDILLVNVVGIVCWFNPVMRIYKKALVQLHEFEADARSVENKDVDTYCGLLAKVALQSADFPLANHFNNSLTLKRINMMKTMKHKIQNWKVAALMAVVPLLFFVIACQEQLNKEEKISFNTELLPQQIKEELKSLEKYYDDLKVLEVSDENKKLLDELGYYNGKPAKDFLIILSGTGTKDGGGYVVIGKAKSLKKNESKILDYVDEKATPIFGLESLYKDVSYTLQYPKSARERGIEGKVFIEFVIQTNGEMSDFKVVKGIDDSVDTEALRALMQINTRWRPAIHQGEIVKMKMVLPIVFKLDGSENKVEASTIKEPILDELVAVGVKPN